jgi:DNA-binding NarL/FixJ family response regulator
MVALSDIERNKYHKISQYLSSIRNSTEDTPEKQALQSNTPSFHSKKYARPHANYKPARIPTPDDISQIIELYHSGICINDISKRLDFHRNTVNKHLKANGITVYQAPTIRDKAACIIKMYQNGLNMREIAEHFNVCITTVRSCLVKADVAIRTKYDY